MQALDDEEVFLNIDLMHLHQYDKQLYAQLVSYPGEVIPLLDAEARYIAEDLQGQELPDSKLLTVLNATHLNAYLTIVFSSVTAADMCNSSSQGLKPAVCTGAPFQLGRV